MNRRFVPVHRLFNDIKAIGKNAGKYTRVPNLFIFDADLSSGAIRTYLALMSHQDWSDQHSLVWPKLKTIAAELHCDLRTVQRGIAKLKEAGYIKPTKSPKGTAAFELYTPVSDGFAGEEGQNGRGGATRLSESSQAPSTIQDSEITASEGGEIEPENENHLDEKVQDGTFPNGLAHQLTNLGIRRDRAVDLVDSYGDEAVREAIAASEKPGVRNPAGFIVAFLKPNGLRDVNRTKDFLKDARMPDDHTDYGSLYSSLVAKFGTDSRASELIDLALEDLERLIDAEGTSGPQRDLARVIFSRGYMCKHVINWNKERSPDRQALFRELMAEAGVDLLEEEADNHSDTDGTIPRETAAGVPALPQDETRGGLYVRRRGALA